MPQSQLRAQLTSATTNTVKEIPGVIHALTEGSPVQQKKTLETYFTPDASFTHPLCRTGSFAHLSLPGGLGEINSRWVIWMIYRWYKILSPRIELGVDSVGRWSFFRD